MLFQRCRFVLPSLLLYDTYRQPNAQQEGIPYMARWFPSSLRVPLYCAVLMQDAPLPRSAFI